MKKTLDADILESSLYHHTPKLLEILLRDRTSSTLSKKKRNIIWANNNYCQYDDILYAPNARITPKLITGNKEGLIKPRALKSKELQKERTKSKAEVFTPIWVVKKQNDALEEDYLQDDIETYVSRTWLEITCGEAPYMVTRYDMQTGEPIALHDREGFVDRKLRRINQEVHDKKRWQKLVIKAYQASYGFEWSGDSLLLARENLLYTYRDYYIEKWQDEPMLKEIKKIATIISYNVFQMDGLKLIIPLSDTIFEKPKSKKHHNKQMALFDETSPKNMVLHKKQGIRVMIMNWQTGRLEYFDEGV